MKETTTLIVIIALTAFSLSAQYSERSLPCVPIGMRAIYAMDVTSEITPLIVSVGDGVIMALPGMGFDDMNVAYREKIFDGVALIAPTLGFVSTTDSIIDAINPQSRRGLPLPGFPASGRRLVRCGSSALALRDGCVIRIRLVGSFVITDTIATLGKSISLLSAASSLRAVAYDSIKHELILFQPTNSAIDARRSLGGPIDFLQALSDSISMVLITDNGERPLRAIGHYGSLSKDMYAYDPSALNSPMARFSASSVGGGAVVVRPGANNKSKRTIYYASGTRVDSIVQPVVDLGALREVQSGVAWWYLSNGKPIWHMSGPAFVLNTIGTDGATPPNYFSSGPIYRQHLLSGEWEKIINSPSSMLVTYGSIVSANNLQTSLPHFGWSVDKGESWTTRPIAKPIGEWSIDVNGQIIGATGTAIVRTAVQTSSMLPILQLRTLPTGILVDRDTIVVCADSVYRTTDGGSTWVTSIPDGFIPGKRIYSFDHTIVLQGASSSCISTDIGLTWRTFSFNTATQMSSCAVLSDTSVLGSWRLEATGVIARSDGRSSGVTVNGNLLRFEQDHVFYGTSTGMRQFFNQNGTLGVDVVFTLNKYAELDEWQNNKRTYALNAPIFNNNDQAYFLTGQRIKRLTKDGPTSVASTNTKTDLHVFPNPASTTLTIPAGWCRMYTLTGELVLSDYAPYQREITIENLTTGAYVLNLTHSGNISTTLVYVMR